MSTNSVESMGSTSRYTRLRAQGLLTAEELAASCGVTAQTIWRWYQQGRIVGMRYNDQGWCLFPPQAHPYRRTEST